MSIKYKIAFLFAVAVILILTAVSFAVYFFSLKDSNESFRRRLKNRAVSSATLIAQSEEQDFSFIRSLDTSAVASLYKKSITIINEKGNVLYNYSDSLNDELIISAEIINKVKQKQFYFFSYQTKKAIAVYSSGAKRSFIIGIAAEDIDGDSYLKQLKKIPTLRVMRIY